MFNTLLIFLEYKLNRKKMFKKRVDMTLQDMVVMAWRLDLMILEVFSNLSVFMETWFIQKF